jgi:hypothetical protein
VLNFSALSNEAGIDPPGDITALSNYLTVTNQGSDALIGFDPTSHVGRAPIADEQSLGCVVTGLGQLLSSIQFA